MASSLNKFFWADVVFFVALAALPSSFFNFVPQSAFFDVRLLYMLVGFGYLLVYFKHLPKITRLKGGWLIVIVCGYLGFKLLQSIFFQGIRWTEVATIFRINFFYPVATVGFLLYASKMDNRRLYRFARFLFTVTFALGLLYIISNLTGLNFYANQTKAFKEFHGVTIKQNLLALPDYNVFLYAFALLAGLAAYKFRKHWLWGVPLVVTILSIVRNQMIVYGLISGCLLIFGVISQLKVRFNKIIAAGFLLVIFTIGVQLIFPAYVGRVVDKFGFNSSSKVSLQEYTESGTYAYRLGLIEESYVRTKRNGNLLLGNGYIREASKGQYDFVVGGDTLIAPVLWAEGLAGLFIRILPVFYFLFWGFKHIRSNDKIEAFFSVICISLILPALVNIVQTKIFVRYNYFLFIFYLMMMFLYNRKFFNDNVHIPFLANV